jgi:hypothetical protein
MQCPTIRRSPASWQGIRRNWNPKRDRKNGNVRESEFDSGAVHGAPQERANRTGKKRNKVKKTRRTLSAAVGCRF